MIRSVSIHHLEIVVAQQLVTISQNRQNDSHLLILPSAGAETNSAVPLVPRLIGIHFTLGPIPLSIRRCDNQPNLHSSWWKIVIMPFQHVLIRLTFFNKCPTLNGEAAPLLNFRVIDSFSLSAPDLPLE